MIILDFAAVTDGFSFVSDDDGRDLACLRFPFSVLLLVMLALLCCCATEIFS